MSRFLDLDIFSAACPHSAQHPMAPLLLMNKQWVKMQIFKKLTVVKECIYKGGSNYVQL